MKHKDHFAPQIFRRGVPLVGTLPFSGNGTKIVPEALINPEALLEDAATQNLKTLGKLREDAHAKELHEAVIGDAKLGRMSEPALLQYEMAVDRIISPRFAVEQGRQTCAVPANRANVKLLRSQSRRQPEGAAY